MGFTTIKIATNEELLKKAQESGCISFFIGFESLIGGDSSNGNGSNLSDSSCELNMRLARPNVSRTQMAKSSACLRSLKRWNISIWLVVLFGWFVVGSLDFHIFRFRNECAARFS